MVSQVELIDTLAGLALFADLSRPQLEAVAHTFEEEYFADGQRILRQGFSGSNLYVIVSGQAAGYKADALEAWSNTAQWTGAGFITPNLGSAVPAVSLVVNAGGIDPVTGASMLATAYLSTFVTGAGPTAGAKAVAFA